MLKTKKYDEKRKGSSSVRKSPPRPCKAFGRDSQRCRDMTTSRQSRHSLIRKDKGKIFEKLSLNVIHIYKLVFFMAGIYAPSSYLTISNGTYSYIYIYIGFMDI